MAKDSRFIKATSLEKLPEISPCLDEFIAYLGRLGFIFIGSDITKSLLQFCKDNHFFHFFTRCYRNDEPEPVFFEELIHKTFLEWPEFPGTHLLCLNLHYNLKDPEAGATQLNFEFTYLRDGRPFEPNQAFDRDPSFIAPPEELYSQAATWARHMINEKGNYELVYINGIPNSHPNLIAFGPKPLRGLVQLRWADQDLQAGLRNYRECKALVVDGESPTTPVLVDCYAHSWNLGAAVRRQEIFTYPFELNVYYLSLSPEGLIKLSQPHRSYLLEPSGELTETTLHKAN